MKPQTSRRWPQRTGWLLLIWTGGVVALAAFALVFRMLMNLAGLTT
jgi:hypothetical protein